MSFNPKGQYQLFNSMGRREVYVQAGKMYNTKHEDLMEKFTASRGSYPDGDHRKNWTIIDWMNHNLYAMNPELRTRMIEQQVAEAQREKLERLQAEAQQMRATMMAESEAELYRHQRELEEHLLPSIPPSPEAPPIKPAYLTSIEQKLFGGGDVAPAAPADPFDDILSDDTSDYDEAGGGGGLKLNPVSKSKTAVIKAKVSRR